MNVYNLSKLGFSNLTVNETSFLETLVNLHMEFLLFKTVSCQGLVRTLQVLGTKNMSRSTTKPAKWNVRPGKTKISLGICPVWSQSLLSAWRNLRSIATHWAHCEDSDQTGGCPGWSESSPGAHSFCWFCHAGAHIVMILSIWWVVMICYFTVQST